LSSDQSEDNEDEESKDGASRGGNGAENGPGREEDGSSGEEEGEGVGTGALGGTAPGLRGRGVIEGEDGCVGRRALRGWGGQVVISPGVEAELRHKLSLFLMIKVFF